MPGTKKAISSQPPFSLTLHVTLKPGTLHAAQGGRDSGKAIVTLFLFCFLSTTPFALGLEAALETSLV